MNNEHLSIKKCMKCRFNDSSQLPQCQYVSCSFKSHTTIHCSQVLYKYLFVYHIFYPHNVSTYVYGHCKKHVQCSEADAFFVFIYTSKFIERRY